MTSKRIQQLIASNNIADEKFMSDQDLRDIAEEVLEGLDEDERSMDEWLEDAKSAMELTDIKREKKDFPFKGAANTKYPLTTLAVIQFSSRTLPELIKNGEVVKYRIIGQDVDGKKERKGNRVKTHLNYQVLEQMPNWMDERDRLLNQLAVVGTCFVKSWYDPMIQMNRSELMPFDLIKVNNDIKNLEEAPRVTQYMYMTKNDIIEHVRWEMYRDIDLDKLKDDVDPDDDSFYEVIEQHCWLNLLTKDAEDNGEFDEDEYKQPYIVTIHKASREILRIVARFTIDDVVYNSKNKIKKIYAHHFFSDYHFIPSPRGKFFSLGFGSILLDMNHMTNSLLNQIINCGTLSMTQGGFYSKDAGLRPDDFIVEPGEWIPADTPMGQSLKDAFVPFAYQPPSPVLFQLLETLLNAGKELTSSTEALTGMQDGTNVSPNTLFALIQQGLKVFTAIQRRIFRGFKKELQNLVRLNAQYTTAEEYMRVLDIPQAEIPELFKDGKFIEYDLSSVDIVPVADLSVSTEAERLTRVNAGFQMAVQAAQAMPGVIDPRVLLRDAYKALDYQNIDQLITPTPPPMPSPDMIKLQSDLDLRGKELELKARELDIKEAEMKAKIEETRTRAVKNIAYAESQKKQTDINAYTSLLDSAASERDHGIKKKALDVKSSPSTGLTEIGKHLPDPFHVTNEALKRGWTRALK